MTPHLARHQKLGLVIGLWTAIAWGGRLIVLDVAQGWDAVRVVGSIAIGVVVVWALLAQSVWIRQASYLFAGWTLVIWGRSLFNVWSDSNSLGFRVVHTVLAIGFLVLTLLTFSRGEPVASPN